MLSDLSARGVKNKYSYGLDIYLILSAVEAYRTKIGDIQKFAECGLDNNIQFKLSFVCGDPIETTKDKEQVIVLSPLELEDLTHGIVGVTLPIPYMIYFMVSSLEMRSIQNQHIAELEGQLNKEDSGVSDDLEDMPLVVVSRS